MKLQENLDIETELKNFIFNLDYNQIDTSFLERVLTELQTRATLISCLRNDSKRRYDIIGEHTLG